LKLEISKNKKLKKKKAYWIPFMPGISYFMTLLRDLLPYPEGPACEVIHGLGHCSIIGCIIDDPTLKNFKGMLIVT